ncbi:bis-aminopropyl spermidine synthase family protein [Candidatus Saccharibacteria bacterium]|nr:bis-aminopropyl spermidine synthase family protein [Candidatus Saccharibacteria bacterium]
MTNIEYDIKKAANSRPIADRHLRQFLMEPESIKKQLDLIGPILLGKKVLFLGDADSISPLLAKYYNVKPLLLEIDDRVRTNLKRLYGEFNIKDTKIFEYDALLPTTSIMRQDICDGFYLNPPYSHRSHTGPRVWLQRTMEMVNKDSVGILTIPFSNDNNHIEPWVIKGQRIVRDYLSENNFEILRIDKNIHNYETINFRSDNIVLKWHGSDVQELRFKLLDDTLNGWEVKTVV